MNFKKMHGNGNDFIIIEDLNNEYLGKEGSIALKLCNRNFGIGADGILIVRNSKEADIEMVIINSDGSYASMCGNGIRCFAKYVYEEKIVEKTIINIKTGDGIKKVSLTLKGDNIEEITVYMGKPSLDPSNISEVSEKPIINKPLEINNKIYIINSLHLGVTHTVIIDKLSNYKIEEGKFIEENSFFKMKTNVNFCEVLDRKSIKIKTWEVGAGPTLACGTGSCASAYMSYILGYTDNEVSVTVEGGTLKVRIEDGDNIYMIGNAENVFKGTLLMEY
ncbi:diaminopimelate epimerase [Clostridium algidicarnis]|uniref:Diaminopimelate epimerase n=1 Tax=Clostridium algidicarnis DSM 15099 TaxID=1121295 RepID=A0A2S6G1J3_9CLOT|nr:diaminopimelate epimerase [Clostridium algidicarnis]MBB6697624.1 diaminopimelate epimerase [Clostridium algidicarnis]MBU3193831.1 diaminopimelate epimerase [Clostridium algidicarnis]MBU3203288.1 diaminopimelate epimerase [Clostridium algidicarnis]MBU3211442.1 diaminopimelate epimerase [Clostridium algidicarnis]MBU3222050.1 diaminopimelate epimerase [Clostridium algidicarnis]